jgi:REP element-mobilizing transposase RayT
MLAACHGPTAPRTLPRCLYHVISRGNQRQKVYKDNQDYRRFQAMLAEVGKRDPCSRRVLRFEGLSRFEVQSF